MKKRLLRIAIPVPVRRCFDYLSRDLKGMPGMRVKVPFGKRIVMGIIVDLPEKTKIKQDDLKVILQIIDEMPLFSQQDIELLVWASQYYHYPIGQVIFSAIPKRLREGKKAQIEGEKIWKMTVLGASISRLDLAKAKKQQQIMALFSVHKTLSETQLNGLEKNWRPVVKALEAKQYLSKTVLSSLSINEEKLETEKKLNAHQQAALIAINNHPDHFHSFLLDGITGSGKTEVYLQAISAVLAKNKQVLLLVPEIALTPQLMARFTRRFAVPIAIIHSAISESNKLSAWLSARNAEAKIIIGTRSAVFTPLANPGLFIIDEEHDISFKQHEKFRYSARDILVKRAFEYNIPIILGSATPSLESYYNSTQTHASRLELPERAGNAMIPEMKILDCRNQAMKAGISEKLLHHIKAHLAKKKQVLLFLNRRGYSPTLLCHECGWVKQCVDCDKHLTYHQEMNQLVCHYCGMNCKVSKQCGQCGSINIIPIGIGTERVAQYLTEQFTGTPIIRVDRDSTRKKGAFEKLLDRVNTEMPLILIGTQMLAKGHHFPQVTLVGILDIDSGLYSSDFRAPERMAQLILQVAGRAGRGRDVGNVLLQTHQPHHPLLQLLLKQGYYRFSEASLKERELALLPPYGKLALIRVQCKDQQIVYDFTYQLSQLLSSDEVELLGPIPAPMEKRAGRYHLQLLLSARNRRQLHHYLQYWFKKVEALKPNRQVQWSIDIDPMDML